MVIHRKGFNEGGFGLLYQYMENIRIRLLSKTEAGVEVGGILLRAFNNHPSSTPSTPSKRSMFLFKIAST